LSIDDCRLTEILAKVDDPAGSKLSRSVLIEQVLRNYFRGWVRRMVESRQTR